MRIQEQRKITKDGGWITIRSLTEQDAEAVLEHMRQSYEETEYLSKYADEMDMTEESERKFLKTLEEGEMTLMLSRRSGHQCEKVLLEQGNRRSAFAGNPDGSGAGRL